MLFEDTYKSIKSDTEAIFRDRGSKFIARAFPVKTEEDVKTVLELLRKDFHDARHHCYAYRLGPDKTIYRINDDGEPSGSAGRPIFGQIQSFDLTNVIVVVVRYFGGTKLGIPGLINAYKTSTHNALVAAKLVEYTVKDYYCISFPYEQTNAVMRMIKEEDLEIKEQVFEMDCRMDLGFKKSESARIEERFKKLEKVDVVFLYTK